MMGAALAPCLALATWIAWPVPGRLLHPAGAQSLTITDRHGVPLRTTRAGDGSLARWVPLERMDPDLPRAFVAVEDKRFFRHHGIDPRALARAAWDNLAAGRVVSGASTVTMQLARLLRPIGRSLGAKAIQAAWALRLEAHLSKSAILEQYLNRVPLGQGAVGVEAAARLYFGASAERVSLGQAALLAGLARMPSSQNPLVAPARARERRAVGLAALAAEQYATADELARAAREPLLGEDRERPFLAPHFTSRILLWAEEDGRRLAGVWRTSLDVELQRELEGEVRHTVEQLADRGARHAAAVVLDNRSGEILAWVGSPDFWADTAGQVDMVVSPRQPGSTLKPFLYALGFDRGVTAASVLADVPRTWQTAVGPYHPRNYDRRYHGPVRAREALASSYNVPAVELVDRIGYATLLSGLHRAGFASLDRPAEHYGLGLALGNGDVTLLELANGYRALANDGMWTPYRWWAGERSTPAGPGTRVVSERSAALTLDILADADARIPGFGPRTPFDWPFRAAAKTGTSRHFTDNWAVAVTEGFTVAVWAGNFSGRPMEGVSGVSGAGPLLHRAVLASARRYPAGSLTRPPDKGLERALVCRVSGMLASGDCPAVAEYFIPGTAPRASCDWHANGVTRLPAEYAEWAAVNDGAPPSHPPRPPSAARHPRAVRALSISSPQHGDRYRLPPGVDPRYATIALRAVGFDSAAGVRWFVDGVRQRSARWVPSPGRHEVRAESGGARAEATILVEDR
jgi:penicillin-binding protein 1C